MYRMRGVECGDGDLFDFRARESMGGIRQCGQVEAVHLHAATLQMQCE